MRKREMSLEPEPVTDPVLEMIPDQAAKEKPVEKDWAAFFLCC